MRPVITKLRCALGLVAIAGTLGILTDVLLNGGNQLLAARLAVQDESSLRPASRLSTWLIADLSERQIEMLELLNRADVKRLPALDDPVVPVVWHSSALAYSPFPDTYRPRNIASAKLVVVHQPLQAFAAYEDGRQVRWGAVSSGRRSSQTPKGLFHLNWRSRGRRSTVNREWFLPWYFNFHNERGLSFHEYALPGHPASHACVRLFERDARWLHEWGETWVLDEQERNVLGRGTPVLVLDCYDFDAPPLWRSPGGVAGEIELPEVPRLSQRSCD